MIKSVFMVLLCLWVLGQIQIQYLYADFAPGEVLIITHYELDEDVLTSELSLQTTYHLSLLQSDQKQRTH